MNFSQHGRNVLDDLSWLHLLHLLDGNSAIRLGSSELLRHMLLKSGGQLKYEDEHNDSNTTYDVNIVLLILETEHLLHQFHSVGLILHSDTLVMLATDRTIDRLLLIGLLLRSTSRSLRLRTVNCWKT